MPLQNARTAHKDTVTISSYDSTGKRKSFKRLFSRFAEKTSMQGVPYIYQAKLWWAKAIWAFLLLGAVAAMLLHLWYLFDQWYSYPKTTKIDLGFDNLDFPQVTICNTNVLRKSRLDRFDGAKELKQLINDLEPENLCPNQYDGTYDNNIWTDLPDENIFSSTESPGTFAIGNGDTTQNLDTTSGSTDVPQNNSGVPISTTTTQGRRKRFVSNYDDMNVTKYSDDFTNYQEQLPQEFESTIDSQAKINNLFTELFMDINQTDRARMGHRIEDMLMGCTFSGRTCTTQLFKLHQTSEYGNCWTIESDKFKVRQAGPNGGISLVLFLETGEYLKGLTTGYGARIQFQERGTYPFPADEGVFIPAAMETDIGLKMETVNRLSGNYGDCNDGEDFMALYNITYTRRACQAFCRISSVITECNCFDDNWEEFAFKKDNSVRPCRSPQEVNCLVSVLKKYRNGESACTCENPCREVGYKKSISQRQWPTNDYSRVLLEWVCRRKPIVCKQLRSYLQYDTDMVNNNFLKLNIYYEDLNFQTVTEVAQIELQQFLSDIGGAVGLWIGLSVLSLCEVIQLLIEFFDYSVHTSVKGNANDSQRKSRHLSRDRAKHKENYLEDRKETTDRWPASSFDTRGSLPEVFRNGNPYTHRERTHTSGKKSDDSNYHRRGKHAHGDQLNWTCESDYYKGSKIPRPLY